MSFNRFSLRKKFALSALIATAFANFAIQSQAATYYWDGNDGTAGFGNASGTWAAPTVGTTTAGWSTDATGATVVDANSITTLTTDVLNFGNTTTGLGAGTITISGTVATGNMTFAVGSGAIDLSGGTLTFAAGSSITVNNTTDTISSAIAATTLTKLGTGTLVLSNTNTISGALTVTAGAINVQNNTALGSVGSTMSVAANSALEFQGGVTVGAKTLTNIQGAGVGNAGALRNISGNNSFAGAMTFGNSTRFVSDSGTLTLSGNITGGTRSLILSGAGDIVYSGVFASTGVVNKDNLNGTGTGTVTLSGANTYTGATNISAGTLKLGAAGGGTNTPLGTTAAGTLVTGTGTLDLNGFSLGTAEALSLIGTGIASSGALANSSATAASYSGLVTLTGAASIVANGNILLTNTGTMTGAGFGLTLDGSATGSSVGSIIGTGAGTLTKTGSGTWTLTRPNTYSGATSITGGTLAVSGGAAAINNSSGITINGSGAKFIYSSGIAGTNGITLTQGTLTGSGTVGAVGVANDVNAIISNNNGVPGASLTTGALTFNGAATVNTFSSSTTAPLIVSALTTNVAGTVTINPAAASWTTGSTYDLISYTGGSIGGAGFGQFAVGTVTGLGARQSASPLANSGSAITMAIQGDTPFWTGAANGNWNIADINWKLVTANTTTPFLPTDDVLFNDNATGTTTIDINAANVAPNTVTFNNTTAVPYTIGSTGAFGITTGSLTKNNSGTVTLNNTNTYTGGTTVNAGTLVLGNATDTLANPGAVTVDGATAVLSLGANSDTVGAVSLKNGAAITGSTGVLTGSSYAVESGNISASLGGTAALTKTTAGTVTLAGTNTYTGNTTVSGGTLNITGSLTGNATSTTLAYGGTAANTVVNVSNDMTLFATTGANIAGSNAVYNQTAGTVTVTTPTQFGNYVANNSGYGYFNLTGGTYKNTQGSLSFTNNTGASPTTTGVAYVAANLDLSASNGNSVIAYSGSGSLTVAPGGTLNYSGSTNTLFLTVNLNTHGTLNVAGGSVDLGTRGFRFGNAGVGQTGFLNLAGGTFALGQNITTTATSGNFYANYAGGTLKANATLTNTVFASGSVSATSSIFGPIDNVGTTQDFTGGLTVHTNGNAVTYGNVLLGATGNGVKQVDLSVTGGTGYIGAPLVQFTGGTLAANGSPASGYAVISGGAVTGIVITSPGKYTVDPTVTLIGGGGTGASVSLGALTANAADSGLTKIGAGTLTLSAANTYVGPTTVSAGTLVVNGNQAAATGIVSVAALATLGGGGTIGGATTIADDGIIAPGNSIGNLSFTGALTINGDYLLETASGSQADLVTVAGPLSLGGSSFLDLASLSTLVSTETYVIAGYSSLTGTFGSIDTAISTTHTVNYNYSGLNQIALVPNVIPEPSTLVLGGLALLSFAGVRLRKRRLAK